MNRLTGQSKAAYWWLMLLAFVTCFIPSVAFEPFIVGAMLVAALGERE